MSQEKLVLVVKVHEVTSPILGQNPNTNEGSSQPTVKATFTSPGTGQSYAWSTQEGKYAG